MSARIVSFGSRSAVLPADAGAGRPAVPPAEEASGNYEPLGLASACVVDRVFRVRDTPLGYDIVDADADPLASVDVEPPGRLMPALVVAGAALAAASMLCIVGLSLFAITRGLMMLAFRP